MTEVTFTLYGSFARTYKGHGTDRALLGGVLGFATDDLRIRDAFSWAEKMGVKYQYIADKEFVPDHPNTVDIRMTGENGTKMQVQGQSIGGGKIKITQINGINVEFTGEYSTLVGENRSTNRVWNTYYAVSEQSECKYCFHAAVP